MKLSEHLDLINGSVLVQIIAGGEVIYRGYKGNAVATQEVLNVAENKVLKFEVKTEVSRRTAPVDDILPINELNSGQYNYGDLRMRLFYTYTIEK